MGVLTCLVLMRGLDSLPTGLAPLSAQRRDQDFELAVAVQHLGLVDVVEFQRLGQREDMFVPVVAHQCCADRLDGGMAAHIAVGRQHVGIALASQQWLG